jgi:quinol monooxygenase YgiN
MASTNQPRLSVHVQISVKPQDVPAFLDALKPCQNGCLSEKECLYFDVFHDGKGNFRFLEIWTGTEEWFRSVQMNRSYYEPYTSITQPMWTKERLVEFSFQEEGWLGMKKAYVEGAIKN